MMPSMPNSAVKNSAGFTLVELLVSVTVLMFSTVALAGLLVHSSRINKSQQLQAQAQSNARNCQAMIVQKLRSAGWDPMNAGIETLVLDADTGDEISEIEIFADLDGDSATDGPGEQILIRHSGTEVAWRPSSDPDEPFVVLATNITNDADADGAIEPMFVPQPAANPSRITVRITASSPEPDPMTGELVRYTVTSDVTLRKAL